MSSPEARSQYEDEIRELQLELLRMLPERVRDLRSALALVATESAARTALQRVGHQLAGTAGTVGLDAVGVVGRAVERYVVRGPAWTAEEIARVAGAVAALEAWTLRAAATGHLDGAGLLADPRVVALRSEAGA